MVEGSKFIGDTKLEKTLIMHMQEKNIHGKIFGGYLMRESFEIAWLCAHLHANGDYPAIIHIDDINFLASVDIGSGLTFTGTSLVIRYIYLNYSICNIC